MMVAAWAGFRLGFGLIVAIGAQNALVLRQGLGSAWRAEAAMLAGVKPYDGPAQISVEIGALDKDNYRKVTL